MTEKLDVPVIDVSQFSAERNRKSKRDSILIENHRSYRSFNTLANAKPTELYCTNIENELDALGRKFYDPDLLYTPAVMSPTNKSDRNQFTSQGNINRLLSLESAMKQPKPLKTPSRSRSV